MFRRKWSGLPADPNFPVDLAKLGYFINEDDEVRAIDNPDNYFHFFFNRNTRWNERQRYSMNQALQYVIWERLEKLGLKKELLPLGTSDTNKPHVPIFISSDIATKSRVVVIFGETVQDLGVLAHRIVGGPGGINKGSMISVVSALQKQCSSSSDSTPPGIILANMGELIWYPEGKRTLSRTAFAAAPMQSAVHYTNVVGKSNMVERNSTARMHVGHIFQEVIPHFTKDNAKIDIIVLGGSADYVEEFLDLPLIWNTWKNRISCLAIVGGLYPVWDLKNDEFVNVFLRNKARAYVTSVEPAGMVISGPEGNPKTTTFTQIGCPVFSSGEPNYTETALITGSEIILDWLQEVAMTPEGKDYTNPYFHVDFADPVFDTDEPDWSKWQNEEVAGQKDENDKIWTEQAHNETSNPQGEKPNIVMLQRGEDKVQTKKENMKIGKVEDENKN
ncbi:putative arb2 domain-containing protein [Daldinia childiae]|uniref:putative arb2 domain-containing protein n=1 Tax=Daldinia childiae TaxID=326645 RepID=UPI001448590C|nr:putative arb2 domain-containing protein [Daldinia childiae]KAF3063525.1 putative arb2 domain-containing protein [Daldinia childiae]